MNRPPIRRIKCMPRTLCIMPLYLLRKRILRLSTYWINQKKKPSKSSSLETEMGNAADIYIHRGGDLNYPDVKEFFVGYGHKPIEPNFVVSAFHAAKVHRRHRKKRRN